MAVLPLLPTFAKDNVREWKGSPNGSREASEPFGAIPREFIMASGQTTSWPFGAILLSSDNAGGDAGAIAKEVDGSLDLVGPLWQILSSM